MKKSFKNILKTLFVLVLIIPCMFVFSACSGGKSAYELAVEQGFEGTLDDWLNSLKGTDGKNGTNGTNGKDAANESSYEMWQNAKQSGEFSGTYLEFLEKYFVGYEDCTTATNQALSSVVEIKSAVSSGGSGVIFSIDSDFNAFIITNYHVAYGHTNFTVKLYGSDETFGASFVGGSSTYDIAVLYAETSNVLKTNNAKAAIFNLNTPKVGSTCIAVGNTNLEGINVTRGCISKDSENYSVTVAGSTMQHRLLSHTAFITNGNSGGGLFNTNGELIGVTNGGLKSTSTVDNSSVKLAIPASIVYTTAKNIIATCFGKETSKISVCNLGLEFSSTSNWQENVETGLSEIMQTLTISSISENCVFKDRLSAGDKLISFKIKNGTEEISKIITRDFDLDDYIIILTSGYSIELTFSRNDEPIVVSAQFEELVSEPVA